MLQPKFKGKPQGTALGYSELHRDLWDKVMHELKEIPRLQGESLYIGALQPAGLTHMSGVRI